MTYYNAVLHPVAPLRPGPDYSYYLLLWYTLCYTCVCVCVYIHMYIYIYIYIYMYMYIHQQDKSLGLLREYGTIVVAQCGRRRKRL